MLQSTELRCTLLSYAAPYLIYSAPSGLRYSLRISWALPSYATAFRATLYTIELRLTLNELLGTLKNIIYPAHRSFAHIYGDINDV
jgi:hypothetical protein